MNLDHNLEPTAIDRAIHDIVTRARSSASNPQEGFPHTASRIDGRWTRTPTGDWTGGFFLGQLWLGCLFDDDPAQRALASDWAARLGPRADSHTIFRGFLFWYGIAIGTQQITDEHLPSLAVHAARTLAADANPATGAIPLGPDAEEAHDVGPTETNIDGVPGTVPLLFWAAARTGDPSLRKTATRHASAHIQMCLNPDGSVIQSATFDPDNGQLLRRYTHKGYRPDSIWARAQAWGMLGLAQAACLAPETYLRSAEQTSDWWLAHVPAGTVTRYDFDDPAPDAPTDTSATAIAAAALLKLAALNPARAQDYRARAQAHAATLVARHLTDGSDERPAGMLLDGCYNRHLRLATSNELVWGTYFLLETLMVLSGRLDTRAV